MHQRLADGRIDGIGINDGTAIAHVGRRGHAAGEEGGRQAAAGSFQSAAVEVDHAGAGGLGIDLLIDCAVDDALRAGRGEVDHDGRAADGNRQGKNKYKCAESPPSAVDANHDA